MMHGQKNIKSCRENQNTFCVQYLFFFENWAVYEIMWKNTVERGKQQMIIWRMRITWRTNKATHTYTHSECVITIVFALQQWLHEHTSVLRCTYITSIVSRTKHKQIKWTVRNPLKTQKQNLKKLYIVKHETVFKKKIFKKLRSQNTSRSWKRA